MTLQKGAELPDTALEPPHDGETDNDELEALERSILNYRDLLRQVTAYPNRKLKQPDFLPYDPADSLADPCAPFPPVVAAAAAACAPGPSSGARHECRLKTLEELSDAYFVSVTVEQLTDTERRLRGDRSALHNARLIRDLSRRLPLTNFLFDLWNPEEGQLEEEVEEEKKEEKGPGQCLERFFSCTEEPPIGPQVETEGSRTPATEERGMAGSVSSGDSIEVLGTERSYRTQLAVTGEDHRGTLLPLAMALKSLTQILKSNALFQQS